MKQCSKCKTQKPVDAFYVDLSRPSGRTLTCKTCNNTARNDRRRRRAASARARSVATFLG